MSYLQNRQWQKARETLAPLIKKAPHKLAYTLLDIDIDIEFVKNRIIDLKMAKEIEFFGHWKPFLGSLCSKISVSISKISILISILVRNRLFFNIDIDIDFEIDTYSILISILVSKQLLLNIDISLETKIWVSHTSGLH